MVILDALAALSALLFQLVGKAHCAKNTAHFLPALKPFSYAIVDRLEAGGVLQSYLYHFYPEGDLNVTYVTPYQTISVDLGNYLSPFDVIEEPFKIEFKSFKPFSDMFFKHLYSLVLVDIDGENGSENCNSIWINISINEKDLTFLNDKTGLFKVLINLKKSQDLVRYIGAQPQLETGEHRYVFVLFRQKYGYLPFQPLKFREHWGSRDVKHGVQQWAEYYHLEPIAVNYFISSNEGLFI